jgi:hypothetical protein
MNHMVEEAKKVEEKNAEQPASVPEKTAPQFIGLKKTEPVRLETTDAVEDIKLRELVEKNLKWSQIIYEQNRRISRRLLWGSIASWVKWAIIIGALVWGTWYAWPMTKGLIGQYQSLITGEPSGQKLDAATLDKILKMIPLSDAEKEQIKAMNK